MKAKSGTYRIGIRKTNRALVKSSYVKDEKQTNERTNLHLSENVRPQKNLYRFFSFNFYIELFGVFVRKSFLENAFRLSFSS